MPIDSLDKLVAAMADNTVTRGAQRKRLYQHSIGAKAAGTYQSMWSAPGNPGVGATPPTTPGGVPTRATLGAIDVRNPQAGDEARLARLAASGTQTGTLILCDRLYHVSGLSGTVATAQNVDPTPTNPVNRGAGIGSEPGNIGDDVEIWLEVYTPFGASGSSVSATYTNSAGTTGRTTFAVPPPATPVAGQMFPLPLATGDRGVRSVQSVTLSPSTGTAGNYGVTLVRRLADLPISAVGGSLDFAELGLPKIPSDACLFFAQLVNATSTGNVMAAVDIVQGL